MLCGSGIKIWNLASHMKNKTKAPIQKARSIDDKLKLRVWPSLFHVICKISNFNMWTAKHLAQASCPELTLHFTWNITILSQIYTTGSLLVHVADMTSYYDVEFVFQAKKCNFFLGEEEWWVWTLCYSTIRGRSYTTLARFWPLLTTYLPYLTEFLYFYKEKSA